MDSTADLWILIAGSPLWAEEGKMIANDGEAVGSDFLKIFLKSRAKDFLEDEEASMGYEADEVLAPSHPPRVGTAPKASFQDHLLRLRKWTRPKRASFSPD